MRKALLSACVVLLTLGQFTGVARASDLDSSRNTGLSEAKWHLRVGETVTLTKRDGGIIIGNFAEVDMENSELSVTSSEVGESSPLTIPADSLQRIEYCRRRSASPAAIVGGTLIGGVLGFVIGSVTNPLEGSGAERGGNDIHEGALYGLVIGAGIGLAAGIAIPAMSSRILLIEF